jgi:hypothetical protein
MRACVNSMSSILELGIWSFIWYAFLPSAIHWLLHIFRFQRTPDRMDTKRPRSKKTDVLRFRTVSESILHPRSSNLSPTRTRGAKGAGPTDSQDPSTLFSARNFFLLHGARNSFRLNVGSTSTPRILKPRSLDFGLCSPIKNRNPPRASSAADQKFLTLSVLLHRVRVGPCPSMPVHFKTSTTPLLPVPCAPVAARQRRLAGYEVAGILRP